MNEQKGKKLPLCYTHGNFVIRAMVRNFMSGGELEAHFLQR
jgi:hypothetical protein